MNGFKLDQYKTFSAVATGGQVEHGDAEASRILIDRHHGRVIDDGHSDDVQVRLIAK